MLLYVLAFLGGALLSFFITYILCSQKAISAKEELVLLKSKLESTESIRDIIKNDFVQLANETIKSEQE